VTGDLSRLAVVPDTITIISDVLVALWAISLTLQWVLVLATPPTALWPGSSWGARKAGPQPGSAVSVVGDTELRGRALLCWAYSVAPVCGVTVACKSLRAVAWFKSQAVSMLSLVGLLKAHSTAIWGVTWCRHH